MPESELMYSKSREELPCFNSTIIEETNQIFEPVTAIPVNADVPNDKEAVIIELGTNTDAALLQGSLATLPGSVSNTVVSESVVIVSQSMTILSQNLVLSKNMTVPQTAVVQSEGVLPAVAELPGSDNLNTSYDVVMEESEGHIADHGVVPNCGQFLPVEGGYILVDENAELGKLHSESLKK